MSVARKKIIVFLMMISFLYALGGSWIDAQAQGGDWTFPEQLSSRDGESSEGFMVSDQYGYVHLFWIESGFPDARAIIQYSRFDGETWSAPNNIQIGPPTIPIGSISPFVDRNGIIHMIWTLGVTGPVLYSHAPVSQAMSAQAWSKPFPIDIPAYRARLVIDSTGVMHIVYIDFFGTEPGVYYVRSKDGGSNWSSPYQLDPDIPASYAPSVMQLKIDEEDGLHVLWYYIEPLETGVPGTWIRYSHSLDGGENWSTPFSIDVADEGSDELRLAYPNMEVSGQEVHVIWTGNSEVQREHRFSVNRGETWSPTYRIMGDLQGQSLGDGMAVDGKGRVHFVSHIRYPEGFYHAVWENNNWSVPSMYYLIARSSDDDRSDRIRGHNMRAAIRAGSQLVTTFTSAPADPQMILYSMNSVLNDVTSLPVLPTPTPEPTVTPTVTPTAYSPVPTLNPALLSLNLDTSSSGGAASPSSVIWLGIAPVVVLLLGMAVYQVIRKRA